jgi:hypothetical protein
MRGTIARLRLSDKSGDEAQTGWNQLAPRIADSTEAFLKDDAKPLKTWRERRGSNPRPPA